MPIFQSLVPLPGQERELCSAEGQLAEDFRKILDQLKAEHGADSEKTVVDADGQTLHITLKGVVHTVKLSKPISSEPLGLIPGHWAGMAGFRTNAIVWSYVE